MNQGRIQMYNHLQIHVWVLPIYVFNYQVKNVALLEGSLITNQFYEIS